MQNTNQKSPWENPMPSPKGTSVSIAPKSESLHLFQNKCYQLSSCDSCRQPSEPFYKMPEMNWPKDIQAATLEQHASSRKYGLKKKWKAGSTVPCCSGHLQHVVHSDNDDRWTRFTPCWVQCFVYTQLFKTLPAIHASLMMLLVFIHEAGGGHFSVKL